MATQISKAIVMLALVAAPSRVGTAYSQDRPDERLVEYCEQILILPSLGQSSEYVRGDSSQQVTDEVTIRIEYYYRNSFDALIKDESICSFSKSVVEADTEFEIADAYYDSTKAAEAHLEEQANELIRLLDAATEEIDSLAAEDRPFSPNSETEAGAWVLEHSKRCISFPSGLVRVLGIDGLKQVLDDGNVSLRIILDANGNVSSITVEPTPTGAQHTEAMIIAEAVARGIRRCSPYRFASETRAIWASIAVIVRQDSLF